MTRRLGSMLVFSLAALVFAGATLEPIGAAEPAMCTIEGTPGEDS